MTNTGGEVLPDFTRNHTTPVLFTSSNSSLLSCQQLIVSSPSFHTDRSLTSGYPVGAVSVLFDSGKSIALLIISCFLE